MNNSSPKVLVGSIQKFSVEDGPGIRTTIFLKGCPLNCKWCHNPELIEEKQQLIKSPNNCIGCGHCVKVCPNNALSIDKENGLLINRNKCKVCLKCTDECYSEALRPVAKLMTVEEIINIAEQDKGFYDNTGGGITISGGEPLLHFDSIVELIDKAKNKNINVCIETCGFGKLDDLMEIALKENVTDIFYDIKAVDDIVHKKYTGVSNKLIIDNLKKLAENETLVDKITIRMPLINGVNDSEKIIEDTGMLFKKIGIKKVNLLPYHTFGISKKRNVGGLQEEFQRPTEERLEEIEIYFKNNINLDVEKFGRI